MNRAKLVRARSRWALPGLVGGMLAAALIGAGVAYESGRQHGLGQAGGLAHQYAELLKSYDGARQAYAALSEENTVLVRSGEIEQQAHQEVGRMMRELQAELLELREELAFYRGIVSPTEAQRGLRLKALRLEPMAHERLWRYRVILTQVMQNDTLAEGKVTLQVHGVQDDAPSVLSLASVSEKGVTDLSYRFRYFQNLDGELLLPEGFLPLRAEVRVAPRRGDALVRTFEWPSEEDPDYVAKEQQTFHLHD